MKNTINSTAKRILLLNVSVVVFAIAFFGGIANGNEVADGAAQVIVLKLDDVVAASSSNALPVSPRWQRITDFLKESNIKASYGIIGYSLEEDNESYFNWIKDLHNGGQIEFWNHGYRNRKSTDKAGEFEGAYDEQKVSLVRTQTLAKEKLGIELKVFGPHWSGTNEGTVKALDEIPEIKMWFYGPNHSSKVVFSRHFTLENPTHVSDFEKFKTAYEKVGHDKKCLALQGHPASWDDERWQGFVKIIDYLKSKGCTFMTPSQYMMTVQIQHD
ncbi:hypothetical protein CA13_69580 [Planctomycetes bacterium CA13]|uniref:Polysaccharide deacetylase n=1 Tax=Novipirellula herctigrandis TaxID=2527986 RepID=A0A5C5YNI8_9BACT|nr:hypothetical protein CA13_69580 [Planctomycetes bacterium CA13]